MRLSSRPETEEEPGITLEWLSKEELELISAFLWPTRLGKNISPYRDAAFSLMGKIIDAKGNNFMSAAALNVDLMIDVVDHRGFVIQSISQNEVEFSV